MYDNDKPFEVKDARKNPEETCEFEQISDAIKKAISTLPRRERELIESKFFQEKKKIRKFNLRIFNLNLN